MSRNLHTKRLSSGKYVDLSNLSKDDIDIDDIARALNYIYRFTGHWKDNEPLTVAQHTKLVIHLSKILFPGDVLVEFDCVLHDFAEAYTGDIATPLKKLFGPQFKEYENTVEDTIYEALWVGSVPHSKDLYENRKICDLLALDIERRSIWIDPKGKDHWPNIPMDSILTVKEKKALYLWAKEQRIIDITSMYNDVSDRVLKEYPY